MKNILSHPGFTLIELLIVLAIIGIIAAFSFPAYQSYLIELRRQDAIQSIRNMQMEVEEFIVQNDALPTTTDFPAINSEHNFYTVTYIVEAAPTFDYRIEAIAKTGTSQNDDTGCTTIFISNKLDTTSPPECK